MKKVYLISIMATAFLLTACGHHGSYKKHSYDPQVDLKSREAISAFYEQGLTVVDGSSPSVVSEYLADDFESNGSVESKNADELLGELGFYWQIVPDMKWDVQEIIQEGNRYVVRSIATGSPVGDFLGIPTDGSKSFNMMTIDIHTIVDGKITQVYHLEDWPTAMQQLAMSESKDVANSESK